MQAISCKEGQVFNGWNMSCANCTEEFGNGTLTCDNSGATTCLDSHFLTSVKVNEVVSNNHCKACNETIDYCTKCKSQDQCSECLLRYFVDNSGKCSACDNFCYNCTSTTQCTVCEPDFLLHPNKFCYTIVQGKDKMYRYRLNDGRPFDFTLSEDRLKTIWTKITGRGEIYNTFI